MISNCQECENLIRNINREIINNKGFMQNPEEQYKQRNKYLEVLKYTLENNKLYHLYDIWQVFSQARNEATRGFFLDLWDLYNQQEDKYKNQREKDILRYFVGQIHDQFDEILLAKKITAPYLWQKHIQDLIRSMCIEGKSEMELQRKLLYSMSHLYVYLYPNKSISVKEEKESLIRQLQIAEAAIFCRTIKGKPTINLVEIFNNDKNINLAKEFTRSFLYLYRFANHFATVSFEDFVARAIDSLKEEEFIKGVGQETGRKILEQLLRYWGATAPLMRFFLQEKLNFKFYEYHEEKPIELPSPHGTDNFVYTIGASGVGKTSLFHAMEHFSNENEGQLPLSIEYIDASEEDKESDREKWQEGEELKVRENYLIQMRSKVRHLCRFTFSEIEDTHIVVKNYTGTKWQSLQGYFERRSPSAIILVFSTEEDKLESSNFLVDLLNRLAVEDERYRNIPIYFTFNQSDRLLADIQSQCARQMFDEFQSYLNSEVELSKGFNFFSLRYQIEDKQIDPLEIANRTKACCANLAFSDRLERDLKRVREIIKQFLDANFTNLNFIYSCSEFKSDRKYFGLQTLWSDLSNFIIKATYRNIESYYQREFKEKLTSDFRKVDLFFSEAAMTSSLEIDRDIFKSLNKAPNFDVMRKDFNNVLKTIENNSDRDAIDILSLISGFEPIQSALNSFVQEKEFIDSFLTKLLRANLKELGMPLEQSYIYNTETLQFIDFYLREIEFIEPDTINYYDNIWWFNAESRNVDYFIEDPEYQPVAREIRDIFFKRITDYNNGKPEQHQIQINKDNLETIIKLLPRQLRAFDIANRSEAFEASINDKFLFSKVLDNEIALCRVQCGKFDDRDRSLILGTGSEQTIFERFCELDDEEESKKYCQLLSNYLPEYPQKPKYSQFILVKRHESDTIQVELDEIKISVLTSLELEQKLKEQQDLLLKMISILSKNWRQFKSIDCSIPNKYNYEEYIVNLYLAQYLLKILEAQGFNIKLFQEKPQEILSRILNLFSKIANLLERTQKSNTQINLDDFREDYQSIKISRNSLSLNPRDISKQAKEIELELNTAYIIYQEIFDRVDRDEERLKSLLEDIIQQSSFLQTNEYNNFLKVYEKKRKLLIIKERVEYLRSSKWIEDLQWLNDFFKNYTNNIWRNLSYIDPKKIKQLLTENIDELLKRELFSPNQ